MISSTKTTGASVGQGGPSPLQKAVAAMAEPMYSGVRPRDTAASYGCENCEDVTFRQTVARAIQRSDLPERGKERLTKRLNRSKRFRKRFERRLQAHAIHDGIEVDRLNRPMGFDLEKLERLLQILLQYLPKIIALFI